MNQDPAIDYIKGVAILMVILFHSIMIYSLRIGSILHIEQAVPLFLMVSAYLAFLKMEKLTKKDYFKKSNFLKFIKRIFIPFFLFELIIVCVSFMKNDFNLASFLLGGGNGMGSYYPWLYFQFWLLFPFIYTLVKMRWGGILLIIVSVIIEILFTLLFTNNTFKEIADPIWRLFVGKYIFIIYIAYLLVENKFTLKKFYPLILLGGIYCIIHRYQILNLQPWFYTTKSFAWNGVHWPMYFYTGFFFFILYKYTQKLPMWIKSILLWMGKNSWELFLSQMLYFSLFSMNDMPPSNRLVKIFLFPLLGIIFCVISTLFYNKINSQVNVGLNYKKQTAHTQTKILK